MRTAAAILGAAVSGLLSGLALAVILCLVTAAAAVVAGSTTVLPGIFTATAGEESGALALSFEPHFTGMLVVAGVWAGLMVAAAAWGTFPTRR